MLEELIQSFGYYISNISMKLRNMQESDIAAGIVDRCIYISTEENELTSPYVLNKTIHFPEVFLNFHWCICFYLVSLTEAYSEREKISNITDKMRLEKNIRKAMEALFWAESLKRNKSKWPPEIVNPNENEINVKMTNEVFLNSIAFIFFHEYGHLQLKHSQNIENHISKWQENDADNFSLNLIYNALEKNDDKEIYIIGALCCGLSMLYSLNNIKMIKQERHQDIDIRILNILEYFSLEDSNIKHYVERMLAIGFSGYFMFNRIETDHDKVFSNARDEIDYYTEKLRQIIET